MTVSEERRLVTVLFVDMVGFTRRAESTDPEEVREVQRRYFETVAAAIDTYGGTVEKYIGDAVMAIFGAPRAHGDDPERALRAALAIKEAVQGLDGGLEVRIGVDTGEVVGGAAPGARQDEYTVTGDAVNVAARLQQGAQPGEIVVGATTRRSAAEAFEFAPIDPLDLKGKSHPVEAWRLVRAHPQRPRVRGGETPLVGRRREMAILEAALEEAAEGRATLIGLSGEAGIGKSRLALELRAKAAAMGFGSAWAAALSYASSFPYHVVEQLVDALLDRPAGAGERLPLTDALRATAPDVPDETARRWAAVLGDLKGETDAADRPILDGLTPEARQRLMVQALSAVLTARAAERPLLLVLDDMHWADASSVEVIEELLALGAERPMAVLMLFRPGWPNPWTTRAAYQQVNLDRLRDADARQLVGALAGSGGVDDERASALLHRSGGNPFFLEELMREATGPGASGRLPETVHELLLARIDALPPEARNVLQVASVIGAEFGGRMLAGIEPASDVDGALAALMADDLVVPRGGDGDDRNFAMRHALVHEVAYRSLLIARRKVLHRRIGEWLVENGGEDDLAAIASHFRQGDDLEQARRYLPLAAERAARLNAPYEAREAYLAAAELFEAGTERAELLSHAAQLSYVLSNSRRAVELATEALEMFEAAGEPVRALRMRRLRGRYLWMDGQGRRAEEEIKAAVEGLERLPPSAELALAYSYHAQVRMLMPDHLMGIELARKAIAVADQVGSIDAKVHALNNLGTSLIGRGDEAGIGYLQQSLALALEHNMPDDVGRAYTNLTGQGAAGVCPFPPDELERMFDEMLDYDARVVPGGAFHQWHIEARAEMRVALGRWEEAEADLRPLASPEGRNRYLLVEASSYLALIHVYCGRYAEAADLLTDIVGMAVDINDLQAYATPMLAAAQAARGQGDATAAVDHLEHVLQLRGDRLEHDISSFFLFEATDILTWIARETDTDRSDLDRGLRLLRDLAETLVRTEPPTSLPAVLVVRRAFWGASGHQHRLLAGETVDPAALREGFARHADALRNAGRVFDAARVALWLAEATGDADAAESAGAVFSRLRAEPYRARADLVRRHR